MRLDRLKEMEEYILQCGNVSLDRLASHFSVSINTVRRDIAELLPKGTIKKIYGGVMALNSERSVPIASREKVNAEAKQIIGRLAASLVRDDSAVYLDSGTTAVQLLPFLQGKRNVTVMTNSLRVVNEAIKYPGLNLLLMGGYFNEQTYAFVGARTIENLGDMAFDMVFLGTTGISLTRGLTTNPFFEESIKRCLLSYGREKIALLADSSKFDKAALMTFGGLKDVGYLITEKLPAAPYLEAMEAAGVRLLCPERPDGGKGNEDGD